MDSDTSAPNDPVTIVYNKDSNDDDDKKPAGKPVLNTQQKDLNTFKVKSNDPYEKFEYSLPFSRTLIKQFEQNVRSAELECGSKGFVTIAALRKYCLTDAWAQLDAKESKLVKCLTSEAFKDQEKGQAYNQIDANFILCYGLLLCSGTPREKAEVFYGVLQDGGLAVHKFISAQDKDLGPIFEKLCLLSTVHLFEFARDFTGVDCPYSDDDLRKVGEAHEGVREDKFLDEVYGNQSKLDNEPWLKGVSTKSSWIFDSKQLRQRVFEVAGVQQVKM